MPRSAFYLAVLGVHVLLASSVAAADPVPDQLPAPRLIPAEPVPEAVFAPPPAFQRTNRYAIWDYYGVNRYGQFRPLVVYSPYGSYYKYNGQPFPWVQSYQREFMPYIVDAPQPPAHR